MHALGCASSQTERSGAESFALSSDPLQAGQPAWVQCPVGDASEGPAEKTAKGSKLSAELGEMKERLLALQPGACGQVPPAVRLSAEDDGISIAASATLFEASDIPSQALGLLSRPRSLSQGSEDTSMGALVHLQLNVPQEGPALVSVFFRRQQALSTFAIPPSKDYIREHHSCWRDLMALSHST